MATTTNSEDTEQSNSDLITAVFSVVEGLGVMALFGSFMVFYMLGIVVVNETIGAQLARGPDWFLFALNSVAGIPVVTAMILCANYFIGLWVDGDVHWGSVLVHGAGIAAVAVPVFHLLGGVSIL